jgi:hypothetical protein
VAVRDGEGGAGDWRIGALENARAALRAAWGEHGTWVVALVSCGTGLLLARRPGWEGFLLLPGVALFTGAKGLATKCRRSGRGWAPLALFLSAGAACVAPAALASPLAALALALLVGPFSAFYFVFADSPRWTRALAVELAGTFLLASTSGFALLLARPEAFAEALSAWGFFGLTYLPGVLRARIPKDPSIVLKVWCTLLALAGPLCLTGLALSGRCAWWALLAAPPLLKDAYRAWVSPAWSTKKLGLNLTLKAVYVSLVVGLAWRPG